MTDEEKSKELTRSSYAAQMAMLGYEPNGNPKDMVEVVRCKDCKYFNHEPDSQGDYCDRIHWSRGLNWFCADGKRMEKNA